MNELKINGTQDFMGINIPIITGGFGEKCKIVTALGISKIHNLEIKEVTKSINRLVGKSRLKENVDYIDVLSQVNSLPMDIENIFGIKNEYLSRTKNIFILSERGYTKLIKAMDDDTSWDVMDKFIDSYFSMVETIQNAISEMDMKILNIVHAKSDVAKALAIKDFEDYVTEPLKAEIDKYERFLGDKLQPLTKTQLATKLDTNTITLAKLFKKLNIYTEKKCNVSENFISKFPKIKMIMETENTYKDTKTNTIKTKSDWQWTWDGAKALIDYLVSVNKVSYCENSGFKLVKEN